MHWCSDYLFAVSCFSKPSVLGNHWSTFCHCRFVWNYHFWNSVTVEFLYTPWSRNLISRAVFQRKSCTCAQEAGPWTNMDITIVCCTQPCCAVLQLCRSADPLSPTFSFSSLVKWVLFFCLFLLLSVHCFWAFVSLACFFQVITEQQNFLCICCNLVLKFSRLFLSVPIL
jgi:hypothetical protein